MKEVVLAKGVAPAILKGIGAEVTVLAKPICEALTKYGCRNQIAITEMVVKAAPEFAKFSSSFFDNLWDIVDKLNVADCKQCEKIIDEILKSDDLEFIKLKVEECTKIKEAEHRRNMERLGKVKSIVISSGKIILGAVITAAVTTTICSPEVQKTQRTKITQMQKTQRTKIRMQGQMDIMNNMANSFKRGRG